jgi:molybdopterin synthase sulfur carrier subunit
MKVQVLFFGATADAVGKREIELELSEPVRAGDVFREILAGHPPLAHHKLLFAVNQEYSNGEELLNNGDELAVFTAVSGG